MAIKYKGDTEISVSYTHLDVYKRQAPDHHIRLCNGEGGGVELLPEAGHLHIAVQLVDTLLHTGKHLRGRLDFITTRETAETATPTFLSVLCKPFIIRVTN